MLDLIYSDNFPAIKDSSYLRLERIKRIPSLLAKPRRSYTASIFHD
jgi:hypothetical protein